MRKVFELGAARGDAEPGLTVLWKGLEVTGLDGTTMELARDGTLTRVFGSSSECGRPLLRIAAHVRTASRRWTGAEIGSYHDGENDLAGKLEWSFRPGMPNLADRGFFSTDRFVRFSATGAGLAWRVKDSAKSIPCKTLEILPDGSELVVLHESDGMRVRRRRRLARANYLRPAYLRRYLASPKDGTIRIELLAAMAGRSPAALEHAPADQGQQQDTQQRRGLRAIPDRITARTALFTAIRRDAAEHRLSHRALADCHGVHRRTVLQALRSPVPAPRKPLPPRKSRLEPFKPLIRDMVQADCDGRRTVISIMHTLVADHAMTGISYSTVRNYVISLRGISRQPRLVGRDTVTLALPPGQTRRSPAMTWSPAHLAVEQEDLPQLRDLLDAGHDIEDDDGHGWTLLRHAIDAEHDGHIQTGGPLHADVTAFLLARGR